MGNAGFKRLKWFFLSGIILFAILFLASFSAREAKIYGVSCVIAWVVSYGVFFGLWALLSWLGKKKLKT